jgi:guanylate kinase
MQNNRKGLMLVLSSPSGAGKTTLSRMLLQSDGNITLSVSATTRGKRPAETEGIDYFFVDKANFLDLLENHEFLEHAKVFDNYYGTPKQFVTDNLLSGKDVLFDIDWQGTHQLTKVARDDLVTIFILPPSINELERRLLQRDQDSAEIVQKRMSQAKEEISHWNEYDYVIINDDLTESLATIQKILEIERIKRTRQLKFEPFVKELLA